MLFRFLRIPASMRALLRALFAFTSFKLRLCCAFSPLTTSGFDARIPALLHAFASCSRKFWLHCSLCFASCELRLHSLRALASCELRLLRALLPLTYRLHYALSPLLNSGFAARFCLLHFRKQFPLRQSNSHHNIARYASISWVSDWL